MYKHRLRRRVFEKGQWLIKIVHSNSDRSTGILDIHGKEIFEGDKVKSHDQSILTPLTVRFNHGSFYVGDIHLDAYDDGELEITGQANEK